MGDEIPAKERLKYLNEIYDGLHYEDARRPQIAKQIEELDSMVNSYRGDPYYPDLAKEYGHLPMDRFSNALQEYYPSVLPRLAKTINPEMYFGAQNAMYDVLDGTKSFLGGLIKKGNGY